MRRRWIIAFLLAGFCWAEAAAQVPTGVPPFNSFGGGPFDIINLGDLNVHFQIPIVKKTGRGMPFYYLLSYDSSMWMPGTVNGQSTWVQSTNGGWTSQSNGLTGSLTSPSTTTYCYVNGQPAGTIVNISFIYRDPQGTAHNWGNVWTIYNSGCSGTNITSFSGSNGDGSGLVLTAVQGVSVYITKPDGTTVHPTTLVQDRNGNQITGNGSGTFYDTLNGSTAVLSIANAASSSDPSYSAETDYTYQAPAGSATIKVFSNNVTLQANFGCGYTASSPQSSALTQKILFPDGSYYLFTYEATNGAPAGYYTGRIASVRMATGGTISYSYTGGSNGVICADGSTAGITRTTPDDASQTQHWVYSRSGSGSAWTTTVTDPASNTTTINFSGFYETQRVVKDSGNNTLSTVVTCYNGQTNPSTCPTATVNGPITQKNVFAQPGGSSVYNQIQYAFNTLGLPTDKYDYDYYNGTQYPLLRRTHADYASLGNNISGLPSQVSIYDGGGTLKAQTTYTYDEYTTDANGHGPLQSTSAPQHVAVSGSRGNVTTISRLVSGSNYLSRYFSYFDTGNVQNSFDVNGAETTNTYGACGNAFVTNIAEPLSLSRSMAWDTNCSGGVMVSLTDENGKLTTYTYNDPNFWRVNAVTDPLSNQTTVAYGANPPTTVESTLNFNSGTSTADVLTTVDGLGRTILSQKRRSPGNSSFDSIETDYDAVGHATRSTLPYTGTAGQTSGTAPAIIATYDALGRVKQVSDAGGGWTKYDYSQNTVTVTAGPAPSNENTKQRQLIYDGLGRLIQVNEPSSPRLPATAGSGSVTISGSEQYSTQTATSGTTTITVSGAPQSTSVGCPNHCTDIYNSGNVYVTINGTQYSGGYGGSTITASTVASALAGSMNNGTLVTASVSGSTITVTAVATGSATNYSVSTSCSYSSYFTSCGFSASGGNMTGGRDASTTYDNGTVSVTVNGTTSSAGYGQGSTNTSVAAALATAINGNSPVVTASASGNVVNITANTTGSGTNYSLSASSSSSNGFNPPSFSTSTSSSSLIGGQNQSGGLLNPYKTLYSYDVLGNLTGVTQNAQDVSANWQTRSYLYDGLGRMTQEKNAEESATTYYTYDTDSTCGTYKGDLVKKVDAVGNVTCFAYDALHRLTAKTYPSGNYASVTPEKHYVYDAATINGTAVSNAKGRLAEAYSGPSSAKITDEGFSYSARGEVTDTWEWTQHSSGWYHVTASYWANGATQQLTVPGVPTITYAVDSEGRPQTVSASQGQNPVTATTYNVSSLPTAVTLGSSDSDSFSYDANTNRPTQYTFNINGQSVIGNLTWNSNGSLGTLAITDPFNPANQQTCAFAADDLARISSVSCGSIWSQAFSYDVLGNISKSGSISFQPTYSAATNRITSLPGFTPSYDANGNLTNDSAHTYAWDSQGHAITIDSVSLTYDALGRMVEQNRSGSYTQTLYGPGGSKLALLNGQALSHAFVPLSGGATAVYSSTGLSYYRHRDWLGSSRFASTALRAMYYDGAYAPFGEPYSEAGTSDRSFTGQNQNTVTGLYDFLYREHSPVQGRWISPDPAGLAAADLTNPQSLNRYAYVGNDPLNRVDSLGLLSRCQIADGPFFDEGCIQDVLCGAGFVAFCGGGGGGNGGGGGGGGGGGSGSTGDQQNNCLPPGVAGPPAPTCKLPPPCVFPIPGSTPAGVDVNRNIAAAEAHRVDSLVAILVPGVQEANMAWWLYKVRPGGEWDYKNTYGFAQGDRVGNFNYGATGLALGLDPVTVLRGGGWAQTGKVDPSWGKPGNILNPAGGTGPYFGDDPLGANQVEAGQLYYTFCYGK